MKISTKVDVSEARIKILDRKKEIVNEMTRLLIIINNSYDEKLKKDVDLLEKEDMTLTWVLDNILLEKIE